MNADDTRFSRNRLSVEQNLLLQIDFFTCKNFKTIFFFLILFYLELLCHLEATQIVFRSLSENREIEAELDCLFTSGHHRADLIPIDSDQILESAINVTRFLLK